MHYIWWCFLVSTCIQTTSGKTQLLGVTVCIKTAFNVFNSGLFSHKWSHKWFDRSGHLWQIRSHVFKNSINMFNKWQIYSIICWVMLMYECHTTNSHVNLANYIKVSRLQLYCRQIQHTRFSHLLWIYNAKCSLFHCMLLHASCLCRWCT